VDYLTNRPSSISMLRAVHPLSGQDSSARNSDTGRNFTLRLSAVCWVLPVNGIRLCLPSLWRTTNFPKRGSLSSKPFMWIFSRSICKIESVTAFTTPSAWRSEVRLSVLRTDADTTARPTCILFMPKGYILVAGNLRSGCGHTCSG